MVVKIIIVTIFLCLLGTTCLMMGLVIASTKINRYEYIEDKLPIPKYKTYEVKVRYLQSDGFVKTYSVKATCKENAIATVLKTSKYSSEYFKIYSVVSVKEIKEEL